LSVRCANVIEAHQIVGGNMLAQCLKLAHERGGCNACVARVAREGHPGSTASRRMPAQEATLCR
jgi:hypothetical protein